jgi:hypothetical protein
MKSKILEQDHNELIKLNRQLSGEERLMAFYRHSQLLTQLSLCRKSDRIKDLNLLKEKLTQ